MAMNTQSVAALLNFFPLSGVFTTLTLKMQASPFRKPRDTLLGVFPELWYGDETERPKRWIPLGSAQFYLLLFQACEGPLPQFVSDIIYKSIHGIKRSKKEKDSKQKQLPASEEVLKHPLISIPTISYLFIRPAVYAAFSFLSHPFSIVRTYYLIKTDLPASEISYFNRTIEDGIYRRSYTSHLVSGVSEIWVGHLFLRFFSCCKDRYFPKEETPSANALRGSTKRGVITAAVRQSRMSEVRELFGQNVVRTLSLFATRTVLFPLFTIRARLEGAWTHNEVRHEGFLDCCSHILQEEGVSGFYRGFPAHIVSFGMQSIYIGLLYAMARGFIQADLWEDEEEPEKEQNSHTALPRGKQI